MNSLKKLKGLGRHKRGDGKEQRSPPPLVRLDELAQASQEMEDMRDCYDSLLSAAAATANSAYEFSESLREMGACLLEKTALNDDEDSGKVLLMLGKVQFELQKLVDGYRSHLSRTITSPSESLLNELRIVEEMKRQCDEKRNVYEYMTTRQKEKGRSRNGKGETFSTQQIQTAHEEYDEEATLFVFRLKSLKQGQSRSLLTQAARHHAAQLSFFKKALKCLEAVEPHVKWVTEQQHIEYQFTGLEDDCSDDSDDDDDDSDDDDEDEDYEDEEDDGDTYDDGELSFDYGQNDQEHDVVSTSGNSMEVDQVDITFPQVAKVEPAKDNVDRGDRSPLNKVMKLSISAPLLTEKNPDPTERVKEAQQTPTRRFYTYVLPTPVDTKSSASPRSSSPVLQPKPTSLSGRTSNLWHSSPLDPKKYDRDEKLSRHTVLNAHSVLKESNNNSASPRLLPFSDGLLFSRFDPHGASDSKKFKRQSFSGPLSKVGPNMPFSREHPHLFSGPLLRNPMPQSPSPPKVSPSTSPTFVSSPKISELHELPRPPANSTSKSPRSGGLIGYSAPLVSRGQEHSATNKRAVSNTASPLPKPPQALPRSFSIPSRGTRVTVLNVSQPLEAPRGSKMTENVDSPPLTPIALPKIQPSTDSETVSRTTENQGTK